MPPRATSPETVERRFSAVGDPKVGEPAVEVEHHRSRIGEPGPAAHVDRSLAGREPGAVHADVAAIQGGEHHAVLVGGAQTSQGQAQIGDADGAAQVGRQEASPRVRVEPKPATELGERARIDQPLEWLQQEVVRGRVQRHLPLGRAPNQRCGGVLGEREEQRGPRHDPQAVAPGLVDGQLDAESIGRPPVHAEGGPGQRFPPSLKVEPDATGQARRRGGPGQLHAAGRFPVELRKTQELGHPAERDGVERHPHPLLAATIDRAVHRHPALRRGKHEVVHVQARPVRQGDRVGQRPPLLLGGELQGVERDPGFVAVGGEAARQPGAAVGVEVGLPSERSSPVPVASLELQPAQSLPAAAQSVEPQATAPLGQRIPGIERGSDRRCQRADTIGPVGQLRGLHLRVHDGPTPSALECQHDPTRINAERLHAEQGAKRGQVGDTGIRHPREGTGNRRAGESDLAVGRQLSHARSRGEGVDQERAVLQAHRRAERVEGDAVGLPRGADGAGQPHRLERAPGSGQIQTSPAFRAERGPSKQRPEVPGAGRQGQPDSRMIGLRLQRGHDPQAVGIAHEPATQIPATLHQRQSDHTVPYGGAIHHGRVQRHRGSQRQGTGYRVRGFGLEVTGDAGFERRRGQEPSQVQRLEPPAAERVVPGRVERTSQAAQPHCLPAGPVPSRSRLSSSCRSVATRLAVSTVARPIRPARPRAADPLQ